jgi:hypothetical protein
MKTYKKQFKQGIRPGTILLLALVSILFTHALNAQNLDIIGKDTQPFKINGSVSLNQTGYASSDSLARRDPYNYYLSGNLNVNLYGWSVPFSFNFSNQKATFTQPFNNYSLHPQYKWIRAHIGYTSMSFSPYSLNGHQFLGAGIELSPKGSFSLSAMAGRLKKAIVCDTLTENSTPPVYERWGYGFKTGYKFNPAPNTNASIILSVFHANDKPSSLTEISDSSIYPGENLVISTNLDVSFGTHYTLTAEASSSAISRNTQSELERNEERFWNRLMGVFIGANGTTEYFSAIRMNIGYSADKFAIGLGYEHIDPGYETFGAYYFNNDLQNITVNGSLRLFDNKMNLAANIGRQNDNLDDSKASEMKRWITAFNIGFSPNDKMNGSLSYSTFTNFMNIRSQFTHINELTPYDNLDTLNFTQLSSTTSGSINYVIKNTEKVRQNASLNLSAQRSSEKQNYIDTLGVNTFYNINAMYAYCLVASGLTVSLSLNTSISKVPEIKNATLGPSISVNKLMLDKKLRNSISLSYNSSFTNNNATNKILNIRIGGSYRIGKRQIISLNLIYMNRKSIIGGRAAISEFVGSLAYSMNF